MKDFLTLENQLCFALYETNSIFQRVYNQALQPFSITYSQYLLLLVLWEEDGQSMKSIGSRLNLGTGTLTPMIQRLETNGWVIRKKSLKDERKRLIFLSDKGIKNKKPIALEIAKCVETCQIEYNEYLLLMKELKQLQEKLLKYTTSVS